MSLNKVRDGAALTVMPEGTLDAVTSPAFEQEVKECIEGVTALVIDLGGVEYVSSAGLRALMNLHKIMMGQGEMTIIHPREVVRDVFEVTGFSNILNILDD